MTTLVLVAMLAVAAGAWLLSRRATELCAIRVTNGEARLIRGRAPPRLLSDVEDIVKRARLPHGTLRVLLESGSPRLVTESELADALAQQIRNAVGQHTVAQFRTGRRAR